MNLTPDDEQALVKKIATVLARGYGTGGNRGVLDIDERVARAVLVAVGPRIAAQALRDAAEGMRSAKDYGHWNLRSEDDPEVAYSPDVWVERRAARIEKEAGR